MTSVYRINYQLRAHKRDALIEFIKSMLLSPFVLHVKPHSIPGSMGDLNDQLAAVGDFDDGEVTGLVPTNVIDVEDNSSIKVDTARQRRPSDARETNVLRYAEIMSNVEVLIEVRKIVLLRV
jgi:IMP and pyridine-specific 5'-nucleotidase